MRKIKVFISSVKQEFAGEREILYDYLFSDALLGRFFDPFIFEKLPATDQRADKVYLDEVRRCDIYIGLFGKEYGYENNKDVSPTEHEFNEATRLNKTRLIFLTYHAMNERHPKEQKLVKKAEKEVVRRKFASEDELKAGVYVALIRYLEEKGLIRTGPFDASVCEGATLDDLDPEKIAEFVRMAKAKRGFPLSAESKPEKTLTHLNLIKEKSVTNAAVLLFGKQPQRFIISSEVKCAQFHGNEIIKPVPAYQVYKGDVFQLVNQAVDFVLSRIDAAVGTRSKNIQAPIDYEIPRAVIAEAIVNAVAHRDYTSNGSVQVMLFRNRLEIWNPGQLPHNLTLEKLRQPHSSFPVNPLIAEPLYLAGYIERLGTGIPDMIEQSIKAGLKEPDFEQEDVFKTIIWRRAPQKHRRSTVEVAGEVAGEVTKLLLICSGVMSRRELREMLQLKGDDNFRRLYLVPALEAGILEMTIPDKPNSRLQKYRLTLKGEALRSKLLQGGKV